MFTLIAQRTWHLWDSPQTHSLQHNLQSLHQLNQMKKLLQVIYDGVWKKVSSSPAYLIQVLFWKKRKRERKRKWNQLIMFTVALLWGCWWMGFRFSTAVNSVLLVHGVYAFTALFLSKSINGPGCYISQLPGFPIKNPFSFRKSKAFNTPQRSIDCPVCLKGVIWLNCVCIVCNQHGVQT